MSKTIKIILALMMLMASHAPIPSFAHSDANGQHHCHHDSAKGDVRCH